MRATWAMAVALLCLGASAQAAPEGTAGTWELLLPGPQAQRAMWLIHLEPAGQQWKGTMVDVGEDIPPTTIDDVQVAGDSVRFTLSLQGQKFSFDGRPPGKDPNQILGSLDLGRRIIAVRLERTQLRSLHDAFAASKEILATKPESPEAFEALSVLLQEASDKGATSEDVQGWCATGFKAAGAFGRRWQREIALRIASALESQPKLLDIAMTYAHHAEQLVEPSDSASVQLHVLEILNQLLARAGKKEEAKALEPRIAGLERRADEEFVKSLPAIAIVPLPKEKKRSARSVLVELFTGVQCPPCVAADLAFDALAKTYPAAEVVLMEYHLHIPRTDPLTNPASVARQEYYGSEVGGTPTIFFNGKSAAPGGGAMGNAEDKYNQYREIINTSLGSRVGAPQLQARATRRGDDVDITVDVKGIEKPGDQIRLRLVLVEEEIRYPGSNGMRLHHHVARAMPGGAAGLPLTEASSQKTARVNLADVRKELSSYMDELEKQRSLTSTRRPLELKDLRIVAFVQDDATKEVLQATEAAIAGGESNP